MNGSPGWGRSGDDIGETHSCKHACASRGCSDSAR